MRNRLVLIAPIVALFACGGAPTNPAVDWVSIRATTPAGGTTLKAGDSVTFSVSVDATLVSADTGTVRLLITTAGMVVLNNGNPGPPQKTISKGLTTVTLTDTVTIPRDLSGSGVLATVPIWIDGVQGTGQWAKVEYKVQ